MSAGSPDFSGVTIAAGGVVCTDDGGCRWEPPADESAATRPQHTSTKESTSV